jgi:hypothetical protein
MATLFAELLAEELVGEACLLSWSWAGWKCEVKSSNQAEVNDYIKQHLSINSNFRSVAVIPLVQWCSDQNLNTKGTPIHEELYEYRKKYLGTEAPPPTGWIKHAVSEGF